MVGIMGMDPFRERLIDVELKLREMERTVRIWGLLCELERYENFDTDTRKECFLYFDADESNIEHLLNRARERVVGLQPQLRGITLALREVLPYVQRNLEQAREFIKSGYYNGALRVLEAVDKQHLSSYGRFFDEFNEVIAQRLSDKGYPELVAIDRLITDLYYPLIEQLTAAHDVSAAVLSNLPICFPKGRAVTAHGPQTHETVADRTTLNEIVLEPGTCDRAWNLVRGYSVLMRRVYADLRLDHEIEILWRHTLSALRVSTSTTNSLLLWRSELVKEIVAALVGGPAYVGSIIEREAGYAERVARGSYGEQVPAYFRWSLLCQTLRICGFAVEADNFENVIRTFYGPIEFAARHPVPNPMLEELLHLAQPLVTSVLHHSFAQLSRRRIVDVLPIYTPAVHAHTVRFAQELLQRADVSVETCTEETHRKQGTGKKGSRSSRTELESLPMVVVLSACRLAFEKVAVSGELPVKFTEVCRGFVVEALGAYYEGPHAKRLHVNGLSQEELRKLGRESSRLNPLNGVLGGNW